MVFLLYNIYLLMDIFKKLKELNLPLGHYVLVGSSSLAVRGIREANDLDIAVSDHLWQILVESKEYQQVEKYGHLFLQAPDVEIIKQLDWDAYPTTTEEAIRTAEIIGGYPFLNVSETIKFKTALGREKDFKDISLLREYLKLED